MFERFHIHQHKFDCIQRQPMQQKRAITETFVRWKFLFLRVVSWKRENFVFCFVFEIYLTFFNHSLQLIVEQVLWFSLCYFHKLFLDWWCHPKPDELYQFYFFILLLFCLNSNSIHLREIRNFKITHKVNLFQTIIIKFITDKKTKSNSFSLFFLLPLVWK